MCVSLRCVHDNSIGCVFSPSFAQPLFSHVSISHTNTPATEKRQLTNGPKQSRHIPCSRANRNDMSLYWGTKGSVFFLPSGSVTVTLLDFLRSFRFPFFLLLRSLKSVARRRLATAIRWRHGERFDSRDANLFFSALLNVETAWEIKP